MIRSFLLLLALTLLSCQATAQSRSNGIIQGKIIEAQNKTPVEYANVALIDTLNGKIISGAVTDSTGSFRLMNIPNGIYYLEYSFIGYEKQRSQAVGIDRKNNRVDLGNLGL